MDADFGLITNTFLIFFVYGVYFALSLING